MHVRHITLVFAAAAVAAFLCACSSGLPFYINPIKRIPSGTLLRCELMEPVDSAKAPQEIAAYVKVNFYSDTDEQMVRKYTILKGASKQQTALFSGIPDNGSWTISVTTPKGIRYGPYKIQCESLQALSESDDDDMRNLLPGIRGKEYLDAKGVKHWKADKGTLFWIKLWQDLELKDLKQ